MTRTLRFPGLTLAMLIMAAVLAACGSPQAPAPTAPVPAAPTTVAGGTQNEIDPATLGVQEVIVKPDGQAWLYSSANNDQANATALVESGTTLKPDKAVILSAPSANGMQEVGIFYHVEVPGKGPGWLFGDQLNFNVVAKQDPRPTPTLSAQAAMTPTPTLLPNRVVPYFVSIGTLTAEQLGVNYVYLYEKPTFDSTVVALVPARRGAVVMRVKDNPTGPLIMRLGAAYHGDSWFFIRIGNAGIGWAHSSFLNIQ